MKRAGLRSIPNALSAARLAVAPVLLLCAAFGSRSGFALALGLALATDAIDGRIARRLKVVTVRGAKIDSWADLALYVTGPVAILVLWPELVAREIAWVAAVACAFLAPVALGFVKFHRLTSYHTRAAKAAAVTLTLALIPLLLGGPAWPFHVAALVCVWAALEEAAITLTLPAWRADVATLWHARRLVQRARSSAAPLDPPVPVTPASDGGDPPAAT